MSPFLFKRVMVIACLLAGCARINPFDSGERAAIQTEKESYVVNDSGQFLKVAIQITYTNRTGRTVYLPRCLSVLPPYLEKRVNGEWVIAYGASVPDCLEPPVEIKPGKTFSYIFNMKACRSNSCDRFLPELIDGVYRLNWRIYEIWAPEKYRPALGKELPLEQRVSNEFSLSE